VKVVRPSYTTAGAYLASFVVAALAVRLGELVEEKSEEKPQRSPRRSWILRVAERTTDLQQSNTELRDERAPFFNPTEVNPPQDLERDVGRFRLIIAIAALL